ncbi:hypothetical protein D3C86_2018370 [compost metagenome]
MIAQFIAELQTFNRAVIAHHELDALLPVERQLGHQLARFDMDRDFVANQILFFRADHAAIFEDRF